jgi:hypothetical protein
MKKFVLQQCSHPNVVRYLGSYQGEEYLWVRNKEFDRFTCETNCIDFLSL